MINSLSWPWSVDRLHDQIYEIYEQMGIHACMNENCSYMHELPFVFKIHKFDHGDDLVIMAMTGCWSCMKISFMAVFMAPKPKAKFVEIWLNVFDAGVWRLSRRRGVWGVAEAKVSPLKIREWFCTKKSFSKPAKTEVLSLKKHPKKYVQHTLKGAKSALQPSIFMLGKIKKCPPPPIMHQISLRAPTHSASLKNERTLPLRTALTCEQRCFLLLNESPTRALFAAAEEIIFLAISFCLGECRLLWFWQV